MANYKVIAENGEGVYLVENGNHAALVDADGNVLDENVSIPAVLSRIGWEPYYGSPVNKENPAVEDQPRDESGMWTGAGASGKWGDEHIRFTDKWGDPVRPTTAMKEAALVTRDEISKLPQSHLDKVDKINVISKPSAREAPMGAQYLRSALGDSTIVAQASEVNLRDGTVTHEVGHSVWFNNATDTDRTLIGNIYNEALASGSGFISERAKDDEQEFLAESYRAYHTDAAKFRMFNAPMAAIIGRL